jgi:hypothetical protein
MTCREGLGISLPDAQRAGVCRTVLDAWAYRRGITLAFIQPAKPTHMPSSRASTAGYATSA